MHHLLRRPCLYIGIGILSAVPGLASSRQLDGLTLGVSAAYGNTIVTTYPDGRIQEVWLQPNGAWTGIGRTHRSLAGSWTMKGEKICLRQQRPATLPFSYCTAFPEKAKVGDAWTSKDFFGTPIQVKLVAGPLGPNSRN